MDGMDGMDGTDERRACYSFTALAKTIAFQSHNFASPSSCNASNRYIMPPPELPPAPKTASIPKAKHLAHAPNSMPLLLLPLRTIIPPHHSFRRENIVHDLPRQIPLNLRQPRLARSNQVQPSRKPITS